MRQRLGRFGVPFLVLAASAACEARYAQQAEPNDAVVLVLPVDTRLFAEGATLQVRLWTGDQLAALERNARCATSSNPATGRVEIHCPEGIEYQEVTPESFGFPLEAIGTALEVESEKIGHGARFRVLASGPSRDGCNTTSADLTTTARSGRLLLEPSWQTTAKACA